MRRAVLVAIGFVVLAGAGAGHAATRPAYLTAGSFSISLGPMWDGARKVPGIAQPPTMSSKEPTGGWVWASTCTAAPQTVQFTRDVELLGPPVQARLNWNVAAEKTDLKSLELDVNHRQVAKWAPPMLRNTIDLTKAALNVFRSGTNVLTVRATRAALAGARSCNGGAGQPSIALSFSFEGAFATDLRVGVPKEKVLYTHGTSVLIHEFVLNQGKSAALDAYLRIWHGGQFTVEIATTAGFAGPCKQTAPTEYRCPLARLEPGARATLLVRPLFQPEGPGWDHYGSPVQFSIISPVSETNYANNSVDVGILMCEKPSREPACANAKD